MPCQNDSVNVGGEIHSRTKPQATNYLRRFQSSLSSYSVVTKQLKNISPAVVLTILRHFFRLGFGSAASKAKEHTIHSEIGKR